MTDRSGFDAMMKRIMDQDKEILEALGSDYDEEGIPYWEKWGNKDKTNIDPKPEFTTDEIW
jgi:hypothetical protein